ncbi:MAG: hypothetical protein COB04_08465 [Gammaproteobacteria bacterium]|nr:MAG: hypothetical protein COB04_08465 [Gammaproteobacteria bacterium]
MLLCARSDNTARTSDRCRSNFITTVSRTQWRPIEILLTVKLTAKAYSTRSTCAALPPRLVAAFLLIPFLLASTLSGAEKSADQHLNYDTPYAHLDWLPRQQFDQIDDPALEQVPQFCSGTFYAPSPTEPGTNTGTNTGTAADAKTGTSESLETNKHLVTAEADRADHQPGDSSTLTGSVHVQQGTRSFRSDTIHFDHRLNHASMPGKTEFREPGLLILGEDALIDLEKDRVEIKNAQYVLHQNHIHGSAEKLQKNQDITLIDNGVYTSCPPAKRPIWQLRSQQMRLNQSSGWGSAKHVRVEIYQVPLLYIPYFKFPLDDRRQSGFLFPNIGLDDQGGADLTVPYYFNLAPNYDLTYSPRYIRSRGALHQAQLRYLNAFGTGEIALAGLRKDKQVIQQEEANLDPSNILNTEPNRKFAAILHEGHYLSRWTSRINAQYASDQAYFQDLGSDFSVNNRTHLERQAALSYSGVDWNFSGSLQGFQTLDPNLEDTQKPYFQLPLLKLSTLQTPKQWLTVGFEGEYVYFDRNAEDSVLINPTGHRLQLEPSVSLPYTPQWGFVTPTLKLRHLQYQLNGRQEGSDTSPSATVPVFNLDSGLYFERDLQWRGQSFLQTLDPRLFVLHAPFKDQDDFPDFDSSTLTHSYNQLFRDRRFSGGDRIGDHNQISLGLSSSTFETQSGQERFQLLIGQSFFLKDRQVALTENTLNEVISQQEQSPISGEARLMVFDHWKLSSSFSWDADQNINEANTLSATYLPGNGRLLQLSYHSREQTEFEQPDFNARTSTRQSKVSFALPLKSQWTVFGHWNYNLKDQALANGDALPGHTTLESFLGLEYQNCCLQARLINHRFLRETDAELKPRQQIMLQLQLKGLANFDDNIRNILDRTIPGYNERFGSSQSSIH